MAIELGGKLSKPTYVIKADHMGEFPDLDRWVFYCPIAIVSLTRSASLLLGSHRLSDQLQAAQMTSRPRVAYGGDPAETRAASYVPEIFGKEMVAETLCGKYTPSTFQAVYPPPVSPLKQPD